MASINDLTLDQQVELRGYLINGGKLLEARCIGAHNQKAFTTELDEILPKIADALAAFATPSGGGGG